MRWRCGQHRHRIRADLVGDIAIGGNAIGADDDAVDFAAAHQMARHVVGDQRHRDTVLHQFPGGEPRALQEWPCLVGEHADFLARLRRPSESRPAPCRGPPWRARRHCSASGRARRPVISAAPWRPMRAVGFDVVGVDLHAPARAARGCGLAERGCASDAWHSRMRASAQNRLTAVGRLAASTANAGFEPGDEFGRARQAASRSASSATP